ncbi:MarR family winged helix-turn-helix transcriptional regulator [Frondihabitans cladoniiphilus]|uniref:MarR family transcriptional regulator n=1 Tax=Frondihabitans cladoniiphilus TaxID=715785 RepID=A0ABP8VX57_9MICO
MPTTVTSSELADHLILLTGRVRRTLRRADDSADAFDEPHNLTLSQEAVMGHLTRGGAQSTAELARVEGVRPQSMRLTVGGLEELGLVEKTPDPDDARKSLIALTAAGRRTRALAHERRTSILASRLDQRLDADELACVDRALRLIDTVVGS